MTRTTAAVDRTAAVVLAALLLASAALLFLWGSGVSSDLPAALDLAEVTRLADQEWWPWASGAVGLVAVLVGLRWLVAHLPQQPVTHLTLPGSSKDGRLVAAAGTVASTAAVVLAETPGVRNVRGSIHRDRGQLVARLLMTIEREADLDQITHAIDVVSDDLQQVLAREDLHCRAQLRIAGRTRRMPRVR